VYETKIPIPNHAARAQHQGMPDSIIWLTVALIAAGALRSVPVSNDIGYQYWVGRQLLGGAEFGRDIVEVNPPLWFWEAALLSLVGDALRIDYNQIMVIAMMLRAALATTLTMACLRTLPTARRLAAGAGLMAILCIAPIRDLGQRDHIMLLGALPYAALMARRYDSQSIGKGLAVLIGIVAGLGIALKPQFLLIPVLLESWAILRLRRDYRLVRPETIAIAGMILIYVAAVFIWAPAYVKGVVGLVGQNYGAFGPPLSALVAEQPYAPVWLAAAIVLATRWQRLGPNCQAATVLSVAFGISYALQGKGFSYHAVPITLSLLWALWLTMCEGRAIPPGILRTCTTALIVATCAMASMIGPYRPDDLGPISKRLNALPPGTGFAVISSHSWDAFPLVQNRHLIWSFRAASLWTIPAIIKRNDAGLRQQTLRGIADDLIRKPPQVILIDNAERARDTAGARFNYLAFIREEPRIAALLSKYRVTARFDGLLLLEASQAPTTLSGKSLPKTR
jgi:hypothetical protein